ncbi:uncharacterized protein LOC143020049 [Oratosquilla oratoria]|uniref:uncharacterized protein LOC143020049 n=1 Tax=Oratosquilla oratoria TaxID=337810 RepID=UPI003F75A889
MRCDKDRKHRTQVCFPRVRMGDARDRIEECIVGEGVKPILCYSETKIPNKSVNIGFVAIASGQHNFSKIPVIELAFVIARREKAGSIEVLKISSQDIPESKRQEAAAERQKRRRVAEEKRLEKAPAERKKFDDWSQTDLYGKRSNPLALKLVSFKATCLALYDHIHYLISIPESTGVYEKVMRLVERCTVFHCVKVLLRVSPLVEVTCTSPSSSKILSVDRRKKTLTLHDPGAASNSSASNGEGSRVGVAAPKMFAFDGIFTNEDSQTEVCCAALTDVIVAVLRGCEGAVYSFGQPNLGQSYTMLGSPDSSHSLGVMPCAVWWVYRALEDHRLHTGARYSVRVSALQIAPGDVVTDLLASFSQGEQSPGMFLLEDTGSSSLLAQASEVRAPTAERAAQYLDHALIRRHVDEQGRRAHLVFTLNIYQYSVDTSAKGGVAGGRSRLHLIDFGTLDRGAKGHSRLTLSSLGNVVLAICNGQKHLPCKDSKLPRLLRECVGSVRCVAAMLVHVSAAPQHYQETLVTIQLASRVHRLRRRRLKPHVGGSGSGGSSEESKSGRSSRGTITDTGSSSVDPSSSEQSCDTVIYVGPNGDDATDGEHPPVFLPSINSGDNRCSMNKALRGSSVDTSTPSSTPKNNAATSDSHRTPKRSQKSGSTGVSATTSKSPKHGSGSSPQRIKESHRNKDSVSSSGASGATPKTPPSKHGTSAASSSAAKVSSSGTPKSPHVSRHSRHKGGSQGAAPHHDPTASPSSGPNMSDEQWIDGPRFHKSKVIEGHKMKNYELETWIDGPEATYGYMDDHKKSMIQKWVETQNAQVQDKPSGHSQKSPKHQQYKELTQFKTVDDEEVSPKHKDKHREKRKSVEYRRDHKLATESSSHDKDPPTPKRKSYPDKNSYQHNQNVTVFSPSTPSHRVSESTKVVTGAMSTTSEPATQPSVSDNSSSSSSRLPGSTVFLSSAMPSQISLLSPAHGGSGGGGESKSTALGLSETSGQVAYDGGDTLLSEKLHDTTSEQRTPSSLASTKLPPHVSTTNAAEVMCTDRVKGGKYDVRLKITNQKQLEGGEDGEDEEVLRVIYTESTALSESDNSAPQPKEFIWAPVVTRSTDELIDVLRSNNPVGIMASLDAHSLLTKIPVLRTTEIILDYVYHHPTLPPPKMAKTIIKEMLLAFTTEAPFKCPQGKLVSNDKIMMHDFDPKNVAVSIPYRIGFTQLHLKSKKGAKVLDVCGTMEVSNSFDFIRNSKNAMRSEDIIYVSESSQSEVELEVTSQLSSSEEGISEIVFEPEQLSEEAKRFLMQMEGFDENEEELDAALDRWLVDEDREYIEVEEPAEPVEMVDSCIQVTEEDIERSLAEAGIPVVPLLPLRRHMLPPLQEEEPQEPSEGSDELQEKEPIEKPPGEGEDQVSHHPPKAPLSSARKHRNPPLAKEDLEDEEDHYFVLFQVTSGFHGSSRYEKMIRDPNFTAKTHYFAKRLEELRQLHEFYRNLAKQAPRGRNSIHSPSKGFPDYYEEDPSTSEGGGEEEEEDQDEPSVLPPPPPMLSQETTALVGGTNYEFNWMSLLPDDIDTRSDVNDNKPDVGVDDASSSEVSKDVNDPLYDIQSDIMPYLPSNYISLTTLTSLRQPDGASNPNISGDSAQDDTRGAAAVAETKIEERIEVQMLQERLPGNGASLSDDESNVKHLKVKKEKRKKKLISLSKSNKSNGGGKEENDGEDGSPLGKLSWTRFFGSPKHKSAGRASSKGSSKSNSSKTSTKSPTLSSKHSERSEKKASKDRERSKDSKSLILKDSKANKDAKGGAASLESHHSVESSGRGGDKGSTKALQKLESERQNGSLKSRSPARKGEKERGRNNRRDSSKETKDPAKMPKDVKDPIKPSKDVSKDPGRYGGFQWDSPLPPFLPVSTASLHPGTGYDSGVDSGVGLKVTPRGRRSRGESRHGESSGYESVIRDSECSSFGSSQDSGLDDDGVKGKAEAQGVEVVAPLPTTAEEDTSTASTDPSTSEASSVKLKDDLQSTSKSSTPTPTTPKKSKGRVKGPHHHGGTTTSASGGSSTTSTSSKTGDLDHSLYHHHHNHRHHQHLGGACPSSPATIETFDSEDVARYEGRRTEEDIAKCRRTQEKIRALREKQDELKKELEAAKTRLQIDKARWSYELHVEKCMTFRDAGYIEALQQETRILAKRVVAARSRVLLETCFDVSPKVGSTAKSQLRAKTSRSFDSSSLGQIQGSSSSSSISMALSRNKAASCSFGAAIGGAGAGAVEDPWASYISTTGATISSISSDFDSDSYSIDDDALICDSSNSKMTSEIVLMRSGKDRVNKSAKELGRFSWGGTESGNLVILEDEKTRWTEQELGLFSRDCLEYSGSFEASNVIGFRGSALRGNGRRSLSDLTRLIEYSMDGSKKRKDLIIDVCDLEETKDDSCRVRDKVKQGEVLDDVKQSELSLSEVWQRPVDTQNKPGPSPRVPSTSPTPPELPHPEIPRTISSSR